MARLRYVGSMCLGLECQARDRMTLLATGNRGADEEDPRGCGVPVSSLRVHGREGKVASEARVWGHAGNPRRGPAQPVLQLWDENTGPNDSALRP